MSFKSLALYTLILELSLFGLASCRSGGAILDNTSPPALPSITVGEVTLSSDSNTALTSSPGSIEITFAQEVNSSTVTTDNITVTCEESENITITADDDTDGIANNEYTISFNETLSQNASCNLSLGTGLMTTSLSKNESLLQKFSALVSETTSYSFSTPCSESGSPFKEEFMNSDTLGSCLTEVRTSGNVTHSINEDTGTLTTSTESSYDSQDGNQAFFYHTYTFGSDFSVTAKISDFTNFSDPAGGANIDADGIYIFLADANDGDFQVNCYLEKINSSDIGIAYDGTDSEGDSFSSGTVSLGSGTSLSDIDSEDKGSLYLRIVGSPSNMDCSYRFGDTGDFIEANDSGLKSDAAVPDSVLVGLAYKHEAGKVTSYSVDSFSVQSTGD